MKIKNLTFNNCLAYKAKDTYIDLGKDRLTQLVGPNGCLSGDTVIYMADGSMQFIKDLVANNSREPILCVDADNNTVIGELQDAFSSGVKQLFEVQLDNGIKLKLTKNHKLKTVEGWKALEDIKVNDFIEDSRNKHVTGNVKADTNLWRLRTYLMTEGGLSNVAHKVGFTNISKGIVDDFIKCIKSVDPELNISSCHDFRKHKVVFNRNSQLKTKFLKEVIPMEMRGKCTDKQWPKEATLVSRDLLAKMLAIYIDTDGCIEPSRKMISFSTSNPRMAFVLHFWIRDRLKIQCSIRTKKTYRADNYEITIHRFDECVKLLTEVKPFLILKKDKAEELLTYTSNSTSYTQDLVPVKHLVRAEGFTAHKQPKEVVKAWQSFKVTKHGIQRKNYLILLNAGAITKPLENFENTTYCRIKAIKPLGEEEVFDLTTSYSTFIANGVQVHNSGKSSVPTILEELFYSKNSRGIPKSEIPNRYTDNPKYSISSDFEINGQAYSLTKVVNKNSTKLTLLKDKEDISGHTATQTYKILHDIIGLDFATFSKLVYQSMVSSLDFLTATDTNRKKFLIQLLNLERYTEIEKELKESKKEYSKQLESFEKEFERASNLISTLEIPLEIPLKNLPEIDESIPEKIKELTLSLGAAQAYQNEQDQKLRAYQEALNAVKVWEDKLKQVCLELTKLGDEIYKLPVIETPKQDLYNIKENLQSQKTALAITNEKMASVKAKYQANKAVADKPNCSECGSELDISQATALVDKYKQEFFLLKEQRTELESNISVLEEELREAEKAQNLYEKSLKDKETLETKFEQAQNRYESLNSSKPNLPEEPQTVESLEAQIRQIKSEISKYETDHKKQLLDVKEVELFNLEAEKNNAARTLAIKNLDKNKEVLKSLKAKIDETSNTLNNIKVLVDVFGPKGLLAYKIESSVKVFENTLNDYLSKLSKGNFAVGFSLDEHKLDVIVYSSGVIVPIKTLSSGELSKVNIATLLAIRNLMSSISKTNVNVLFLDEIISVIDKDGLEDLLEILLEQYELNTFIVSHNYAHPLVPKITVTKHNNISRIREE